MKKVVVLFSEAHIKALREQYGRIKTVDPEGETYKLICNTLDKMPVEHLKQISEAGIKFLSPLARNRVNKGEKRA